MTAELKMMETSGRPYERCLANGPAALTDTELLAVILRTGTRDEDALTLSARILQDSRYPGLSALLYMSFEDLTAFRGIGRVKAIQLQCVAELARRIWRHESAGSRELMDTPEHCAEYYRQEMKPLEQEQLRLVFLDSRRRRISDRVMTTGTADQSLVSVREILIEALRHHAFALILLHNHPSGSPEPSAADFEATGRVREGCEKVGILLSDHIIIAGNGYYSFKERGFL